MHTASKKVEPIEDEVNNLDSDDDTDIPGGNNYKVIPLTKLGLGYQTSTSVLLSEYYAEDKIVVNSLKFSYLFSCSQIIRSLL